MKSATGGLIFRHSSCSELAPTGFSNRAGQGLEHQPACGCTTSQEQRSLEYSLRKQAGRESDPPIGSQLRFFRFEITAIGRRKIPGGNAYKPVAARTDSVRAYRFGRRRHRLTAQAREPRWPEAGGYGCPQSCELRVCTKANSRKAKLETQLCSAKAGTVIRTELR